MGSAEKKKPYMLKDLRGWQAPFVGATPASAQGTQQAALCRQAPGNGKQSLHTRRSIYIVRLEHMVRTQSHRSRRELTAIHDEPT